MPPRSKITKKMILEAVLEITREAGFEAVNARSIAERLGCSTRPIFTCYENMEELKTRFLDFAFEYYEEYAAAHSRSANGNPCLFLPLSYLGFAKEETNLFKLLFISDMELDMTEEEDFYREAGNKEKAGAFSDLLGLEAERGKGVFFHFFLYTHGIAVLTATGKLSFSHERLEKILQNFLDAYIQQETKKAGA